MAKRNASPNLRWLASPFGQGFNRASLSKELTRRTVHRPCSKLLSKHFTILCCHSPYKRKSQLRTRRDIFWSVKSQVCSTDPFQQENHRQQFAGKKYLRLYAYIWSTFFREAILPRQYLFVRETITKISCIIPNTQQKLAFGFYCLISTKLVFRFCFADVRALIQKFTLYLLWFCSLSWSLSAWRIQTSDRNWLAAETLQEYTVRCLCQFLSVFSEYISI